VRIVFIGSVQFSLSALSKLHEMNADIVGVCTKSSSPQNSDHVDLSSFCIERGITWRYIEDINSKDSIDWISELEPDVIFCFGWSHILKDELLRIAPLGVLGFHPTKLPKNRGRHPIVWALALGLTETGSTFFFMDSGVDSGDIVSQAQIPIQGDDNARTLYKKITDVALRQIEEFYPLLVSGAFCKIKQEESLANVWRKRVKSDGLIDWRMSAESIHNLVRGLSAPYVGAHFMFKGEEIKIWQTKPLYDFPNNLEPGKVILITEMGPVVKCGIGAICLLNTSSEFKTIKGDYL
jgi:methionyl-tRNA formyltransferase